jgi:hypothetical protein
LTGGHNSSAPFKPTGVRVWPDALEAVAWSIVPDDAKSGRSDAPGGAQTADPVSRHRENRARAARRARGRVRRFCTANGLAYLWTLTLADQSSDCAHVGRLVESFIRRLRAHTRCSIPYVWVLEEHKSGNLHAHVAIDRFIPRAVLLRAWPHGFMFVTGARSKRSRGQHAGVAATARYVAKYVSKEVTGGAGRQSYRVAEGFQPIAIDGDAWSLDDALLAAVAAFHGELPAYVWDSRRDADVDDRAPPCWWATWQPEVSHSL